MGASEQRDGRIWQEDAEGGTGDVGGLNSKVLKPEKHWAWIKYKAGEKKKR